LDFPHQSALELVIHSQRGFNRRYAVCVLLGAREWGVVHFLACGGRSRVADS
jgi:hypothetical protein